MTYDYTPPLPPLRILVQFRYLQVYTIIIDRCGATKASAVQLHSFTGQLSSANYPEHYDNNVDCYWKITLPSGIIELQFLYFQTYIYSRDTYLQVSADFLL